MYHRSDLKWADKILLMEIEALDSGNDRGTGCLANNDHFSDLLQITPRQVSRKIKKLVGMGLIVVHESGNKNRSIHPAPVNQEQSSRLRGRAQKKKNPLTNPLKKKKSISSVRPASQSGGIDDELLEFSTAFHDRQSKRYPVLTKGTRTKSTHRRGAETIGRLIRIDGLDFKYIREVLGWGETDKFWSRQLLSLANLRNTSRNGNTKFVNLMCSYDSLPAAARNKKRSRISSRQRSLMKNLVQTLGWDSVPMESQIDFTQRVMDEFDQTSPDARMIFNCNTMEMMVDYLAWSDNNDSSEWVRKVGIGKIGPGSKSWTQWAAWWEREMNTKLKKGRAG